MIVVTEKRKIKMYGEDAFHPEVIEDIPDYREDLHQETEPVGMRQCLIRFFGQSKGQAMYLETWSNRQP